MPNYEDFKQKHLLSPNEHRDYESWNRSQQNNFLRTRLAGFGGSQQYGQKSLNSVIIATSQEILNDFRNPGQRYTPQQDFYWSNGRYPIWLFRRRDGDYSVTKLHERHGPMHFLARVSPQDGNKPIHFHAQAPDPSDHPPSPSELALLPLITVSSCSQPQPQPELQHQPPSSSSCLQNFLTSLNEYIFRPLLSFGNFILYKIIFVPFLIE